MRITIFLFLALQLPAAEEAARIDALVGRHHELGLFHGSVLVAEDGKVVLKQGYGLANREWNIPNAPDTKFRLGSITKQFTAALILQEVEKGTIDLQAPVSRYLPGYPKANGDRVTIHQLLTHTSGIPGYTELPDWRKTNRDPFQPEAFLKFFADRKLFFEPGTKFSYSNSGYFLLGVILEKLNGKTYEAVLQERIFDPAGMTDSGYDMPGPVLSRRASGYESTLDGYVNAAYLDMTQPYAAGSLYSTVEDLYKWDQALYGDKILSARSKEAAFRPGLDNYGYGWIISKRNGRTRIAHGGGINGFATVIVREPETRRLVVLLNNTGGAPLNAIAEGAFAVLEGRQAPMPKPPAAPLLYRTYKESGWKAALAQYKDLKAAGTHDAGSGELLRIGRFALSERRTADAIEIGETVLEAAPDSFGALMLLAEAHKAAGNNAAAIHFYGKALALSENPRSQLILAEEIRNLTTAP